MRYPFSVYDAATGLVQYGGFCASEAMRDAQAPGEGLAVYAGEVTDPDATAIDTVTGWPMARPVLDLPSAVTVAAGGDLSLTVPGGTVAVVTAEGVRLHDGPFSGVMQMPVDGVFRFEVIPPAPMRTAVVVVTVT